MMRSTTEESVMKAMTFIVPPHREQVKGATS
jgi:hypothetical protein